MASYTTLVNVDGDTATKLSFYISNVVGGTDGTEYFTACKALIEEQKTEELITKFLEKRKEIMNIDNEKDVEGCIEAIVFVMFTLRENVDSVAIVKQILEALSSDKSVKTKLRLRSMVSLFNLTVSGQSKYDVLSEIFQYALATGQCNEVSGFHERIESWMAEWSTEKMDQRVLFKFVSEVMAKDGQESLALKFLIQYLGTFGGEVYPADVQALATTAVLSGIKSPVSSFSDRNALLESLSDQKLAGPLAILVELLRILCTGSLDVYRSFESANRAFLVSNGISHEEVEKSVRLLALCSLGAQESVLSYDVIATTLKVDLFDVEMWVVEAMSQSPPLMEASMDQFNSVVTITRCVHRSFGPDQWKGLQSRLKALRISVAGVLESAKKYNN